MPGHNAFQRNAFQRNAFQIVYEFTPVVDGGLVLGGDVTASFNTHRTAVVSGGLVLGGSVTARFQSAHLAIISGGLVVGGDVTANFTPGINHYTAIVSGGLVLGGNVRARFVSARRPRLGTAGRVWRNIFARPRHYKAKISGGLVIGGSVVGSQILFPIPERQLITNHFLGRVSGGLVLGGLAEAQFISAPVIYISAGIPISLPEPDPVSYKAVSTLGGGAGLSRGVRARFDPAPPPPVETPRVWTFFNRHKAQQLEEDELLLMDIL